ncbi:hypothetical protein [Sphingomonas sp.]|uniref:hypothetical protein n=1 Tax=Sphingomonas sp. TaxID=28214 RepID=UPI0028B232C3|nr:hypothetical protein [Sphingomonas sp.]
MRRAVLVAAILLTACGAKEKSSTIAGTTYTTDERAGTASITTANGSIKTIQGAAAAAVAMPTYAPLYPGAMVEGVMETDSGGRKIKMVTLATRDPVGKVAGFYKAALTKEGWKLPQSLSMPDGALISGEKGGRRVSLAISQQDGKTGIALSVPND